MIETVKRLIVSQYEASLCTLAHCVARCPDHLWNTRVAKYPFCQVAFHTLFFADYYLGPDAESLRQPVASLAGAAHAVEAAGLPNRPLWSARVDAGPAAEAPEIAGPDDEAALVQIGRAHV